MNVELTREEVRRIDRLAIDVYGMSGLVLMENAGRNASQAILARFGGSPSGSQDASLRAIIFCGAGNNGGDGYVIARHLYNAGWSVRLADVGDETRSTVETSANREICRAMSLPFESASEAEIQPDELVVDALLGTGFSGRVREPIASVIRRLNGAANRGVVAIDVPSGLDCNTGEPGDLCVVANLTVTFVGLKVGFRAEAARRMLGEVVVADIGVPRMLVSRVAAD